MCLCQLIGSLQKKYSIGSFELLSKTAPIQALSLLVAGPFVDYLLSGKFILNYNMSSGCFVSFFYLWFVLFIAIHLSNLFSTICKVFILLSCALAVFCNISQYLCIGRFSAVSFQVIGHMKTVCILTLGWLLFDSAMTFKNVSGMFVAIVGMVIYSWAMELEKRSNLAAKALNSVKHSLTEEEFQLLKEGVETTQSKDVELGGYTKA